MKKSSDRALIIELDRSLTDLSRLFGAVSSAQRETSSYQSLVELGSVRVPLPHEPSAQLEILSSLATCESTVKSSSENYPSTNHRPNTILSKVTSAMSKTIRRIAKLFLFGLILFQVQCSDGKLPVYVTQGLYQGFVFGWDSMCSDWKECEGAEKRGFLGPLFK